MEFLKNHYEKVILSVVLLGLAVAVAILPMRVPSGPGEGETNAPPIKFKPVDISTNEAALARLAGLKPVVFSGAHNLFSPVEWRVHKGVLYKIDREDVVGLGAVVVNQIKPLYFMLSYEGYSAPRFQIGVTQQGNRGFDGKAMKYATLNEKQELFTVVAAKGPADNPQELTLELRDGSRVTITKDKPYQAVTDYATDLTYPSNLWSPAPQRWLRQRVGDKLLFDQETNNIVAINASEVVLSSSAGKRKKLTPKGAP